MWAEGLSLAGLAAVNRLFATVFIETFVIYGVELGRPMRYGNPMNDAFDIIAILIGLTALFSWLNHKLIRLPATIGMLVFSLAATLIILVVGYFVPSVAVDKELAGFLRSVDFNETLMKGMLGFLLFAGAMHVNLNDMVSRRYAITLMATLGVLLSTALVGTGAYFTFQLLGIPVPYLICLVFGALISPTDPVAVMGVLKTIHVPPSLKAKIAGESLFNDGVGVVVFTILVAIVASTGGTPPTVGSVAILFAQEALGGALLGVATGLLVHFAMRRIDEYVTEIMLTLALVTVTYAVAAHLHVSGLIAVVAAGLLIGNIGTEKAMSETTSEHLNNFWTLIDEILNAILFLLIGLEVVVLHFEQSFLVAGLIAIPLVVLARFISVGSTALLLKPFRRFTPGAVQVLTWGGLRGGISVALALSLPLWEQKPLILTVTYIVVIFSIVVQGLTIGPLIRRVVKTGDASDNSSGPAGQ
jgi:CPA1 family monovalent cation:H+ antiporter